MKCIKTFCLAAVAAAALTASVGASTALAEGTICKAAQEPCAEGNMYPAGTSLKLQQQTGSQVVFKTGVYEIKCNKSEIRGKVETTTAPGGTNEAFSFGECGSEVVVESIGSFKLHPYSEIGGGTSGVSQPLNANITFNGLKIKLVSGGVTCIYSGSASVMMILFGGSPATAAVDTRLPKAAGSSFLCNAELQWQGSYQVNNPTPLYVSKGL
jgi:hypothetical protein